MGQSLHLEPGQVGGGQGGEYLAEHVEFRVLGVLGAAFLQVWRWSTGTLSRTTIWRNSGSRQASRNADRPV